MLLLFYFLIMDLETNMINYYFVHMDAVTTSHGLYRLLPNCLSDKLEPLGIGNVNSSLNRRASR